MTETSQEPHEVAASRPPVLPFVGRVRELATALAAIHDAASGRGNVVLIAGEPGIGKSLLAEEAAARADGKGFEVLWGRAWEAGGTPAYWPWLQALRAHLRQMQPDIIRADAGADVAVLSQLLPELRGLVPERLGLPTLQEDGARLRMFDATASFLRRASDRRPLLVILDDLHAADTSSLLLFSYLGLDLTDARAVLLGTYRSEDLPGEGPARSVLADLLRQPRTRHIVLGGLTRADLDEYVRSVTGVTARQRVIDWLAAETEGNALFVAEIVRSREAREWLSDAGSEEAVTSARFRVPDRLEDIIRRRLGRLSSPCSELLAVASVLGRDFNGRLLARVAGTSADSALDLLDEAIKARVVIEAEPTDSFRFGHVLVRDALYEQLPRRRRADLHRQAAGVIEEISSPLPEERASEIAHHMLLAMPLIGREDADRAVHYATLAARQALAKLAYEEAAGLFANALHALEMAPDDAVRLELLLGLGDALARAGDEAKAKATFLQAAEVAQRMGSADQLARAALGFGGRFLWAGDPRLAGLLEAAIDAVGPGDSEWRARLLARLAAGPRRRERDATRRVQLSREALAISRRIGDLPTLAYTLDGHFAAMWGPDNVEEETAVARELIDVARQLGDRERELQGHHYLSLILLEAADLSGAEHEVAEQWRLARELHQSVHVMYAMMVQAELAILQGRYNEAEVLIPEAEEIGRRAQRTFANTTLLFQRYGIARERGEIEPMIATLRDAQADDPSYVVTRCLVAEALLLVGHHQEARAMLRRLAEDRFAAVPRNEEWLFAMTVLADLAAELGEADLAPAVYELLLPYGRRVAVSAPDIAFGAVARVLGRLAAVMGRNEEAQEHFDVAHEINAAVRARPWIARTETDLARFRRDTGDTDAAVKLLAHAAAEAAELGMDRLAREATAELEALKPAAREVSRTFLFTDIVSSTQLLAAIGDEAWAALVGWHDRALRQEFATHGGEEVDHAGDGFFVAFTEAAAALACAVAIQRRLETHRRETGFAPQVRIGVHAASARSLDRTFKGRGVHEAARIAAAAAGGEILVDRSTLAQVPDLRFAGEERELTLRGLDEPVLAVVLNWREDSPPLG